MADAGIKTDTLDPAASLDEVMGHKDGSLQLLTLALLGAQLVGSGPIAAKIEELRSQITSGEIAAATWTDLMALSGSADGAGAEVLDSDVGTHSDASATGYDGATVNNAGRYSWSASWSRWVWIGESGLSGKAPLDSPALTGTPTAPTAAPGTSTTQLATTAYVVTALTDLVGGAPGALDTLKELADALGDDADFATTVTNALALKAPLASPALSGTPTAPTAAPGTSTAQLATTAYVVAALTDLVGGAPGALDTLNELADALGNDENFAASVTASIALKASAEDLINEAARALAAEGEMTAARRAQSMLEPFAADYVEAVVDAVGALLSGINAETGAHYAREHSGPTVDGMRNDIAAGEAMADREPFLDEYADAIVDADGILQVGLRTSDGAHYARKHAGPEIDRIDRQIGAEDPALSAYAELTIDANNGLVHGRDYKGVSYTWAQRDDLDVVIGKDAAGRSQAFTVNAETLRQLTYFEEGVTHAELADANTHDRVIANIKAPVIGGLGIRAMAYFDAVAAASGEITLIGIDGQSLSVSSSSPATNIYLTLTNPDPDIMMFSDNASDPLPGGVSINNRGRDAVVATAVFDHLIPARETHNPLAPPDGAVSENNETIALSTAVMARDLGDNRAAPVVVSGFGIGSTSYADRMKGTDHYDNIEKGLTGFAARASDLGLTPRVREWCLLDGEQDKDDLYVTWLANLVEFQGDLQNSITTAIPDQTDQVLLYMHQMGHYSQRDGVDWVSEVALAQLDFGLSGNGVCIGPNYMSNFAGYSHLTPESYRHLGGYYGKAIAHLRRTGAKWKPLYADPWTISGRDIILQYHVPVPPLRFEDRNVPLIADRGITVHDGSTPLSIESVTITDPMAGIVRVRLAATPNDPATLTLGIAAVGSGDQGSATGRISNIRDSDYTPHPMTGRALPNWACHQKLIKAI